MKQYIYNLFMYLFITAILMVMTSIYVNASVNLDSPWGICTHSLREHQWKHFDNSMKLLNNAGITWIREDFQFSNIARKKGEYDFSRYDELVERSLKAGITILPILQGFDWEISRWRSDVTPLYKHPEEWRKFVRTTVERYHGKLKYWEIWNEQDGGFWKPRPNASQYVSLLKIAYEEIKKIDPSIKVIVGGLCGWNVSYLQSMYDNGAKGYFDIMAVHPYGLGPDARESIRLQMQKFTALMKKYGDGDKPIWITEAGSTSFSAKLTKDEPDIIIKAIQVAMEKINLGWPENKPLVVGAPVSISAPYTEFKEERNWLPDIKIIPVTPEILEKLSPEECPVIIGTESIHIEEPYVQPMREFVKRGGILLAFGQVPFYTMTAKKNGIWEKYDNAAKLHPYFRIGFDAWWNSDKPKATQKIQVSNELRSKGITGTCGFASRYLSNKYMHDNDNYLPLIHAINDRGKPIGEAMALYTFHDWKGAILGNTLSVAGGVSETEQANILQRVFLTYLAEGIAKIFIYDLHNDGQLEGEREHNYGLLRWNWQSKSAYYAYKELTTALGVSPAFVKQISSPESIWGLVFQRSEDKNKVLAVWSVDNNMKYSVINKKNSFEKICSGNKVRFINIQGDLDEYIIKAIK